MDLDLDLDDLDGVVPSQPQSKFAPKNSKPKPKPKPKTEPKTEPLPSSIPPLKQEFVDSKPKIENDSKPPLLLSASASASAVFKMDIDVSKQLSAAAAVKMDIDDMPKVVEEEEDCVVREIDVYFTPSIDSSTQLYVLQYPLRQSWRPYELDNRCEEVRVKPTSAEVEVDLSTDVDSQNFDPDADDRVQMTKQVLSSSRKLPVKTGYAVGVLMGNKLHLNPVHAFVQLRPSMLRLKSGGSRKKINTTSNGEDMIKFEGLKEEEAVGPSKKQNKPPGVLNEQNKDIEEGWIHLKYHGTMSDLKTQYVRRMVSQEGSHIPFSMSPYDYVNSLCPGTSNGKVRSKFPSIRFLHSLPLEDRCRTWLVEGPPVHRFDHLKRHLAPNDSDEDVLGVLQKLAQLVQGLWVPKSSLLYGTVEGLEVLYRNYILLLFSKDPVVREEKLPRKKEHKQVVEKILNVLAVKRCPFDGWNFKEPKDLSFVKLHPNVVEEQKKTWDLLEKQIAGSVSVGKPSSRPNNTNQGAPTTSNVPPSRTPMSKETREALPKALKKLFQTHKVCSFPQIIQGLRDIVLAESSLSKGGPPHEVIAAAKGVDAPEEELKKFINEVAVEICGVFVSKSSPDHPEHDELRKVVINLFLAGGPNAKIKKGEISEAVKLQLKRDMKSNEYNKVMNELCVSDKSAWLLRSGYRNRK